MAAYKNLSFKKKVLSKKNKKRKEMEKEKIKTGTKKWRGLLEALMVASLVTLVPMVSAEAEVSGATEIELWHVLLAISIFFAILTFTYPLVMRIRRKRREEREEERIEEKEERIEEAEMRREEEVMKILREVKELKEKIEKRGMKLTSISDVFLVSVQILSEIRVMGYRMEGLKGRIEGLERGLKKEMGDARALIMFGIGTILAISLTIISIL